MNTSGFLLYAWVIPYGFLTLLIGVIYLKFLLNLPNNYAFWFIGSGAIFVSGAIGFEMLGANETDKLNGSALVYSIYYSCEELLEMLGIAVFIYALLRYMSDDLKIITIRLRS